MFKEGFLEDIKYKLDLKVEEIQAGEGENVEFGVTITCSSENTEK